MAVQETQGDRIDQAIKRSGAQNGEVAAAVDVHTTTVSRWRNDRQSPEDTELDRLVVFLEKRGVKVTAAWIRYGVNGTTPRVDGGPTPAYAARAEPISQIGFVSATAQQRAHVWLEQFLLELAEEGATQEFIDSSRRLLLNLQNYEHGFGAAAGHRDEMDDEQKLRHMQGLAVGIRAILKSRSRTTLKGR